MGLPALLANDKMNWGVFAIPADLPNVAGAPTQDALLKTGHTAYATSTTSLYVCTVATLGAAVWDQLSPSTPVASDLVLWKLDATTFADLTLEAGSMAGISIAMGTTPTAEGRLPALYFDSTVAGAATGRAVWLIAGLTLPERYMIRVGYGAPDAASAPAVVWMAEDFANMHDHWLYTDFILRFTQYDAVTNPAGVANPKTQTVGGNEFPTLVDFTLEGTPSDATNLPSPLWHTQPGGSGQYVTFYGRGAPNGFVGGYGPQWVANYGRKAGVQFYKFAAATTTTQYITFFEIIKHPLDWGAAVSPVTPAALVSFFGGTFAGAAGAVTAYVPMADPLAPANTATTIRYPVTVPGGGRTFSRVSAYVDTNTLASALTAALYINNVATGVTCVIGIGVTGTVFGVAGAAALAADGDISLRLSNTAGGAGNTLVATYCVEYT